MKLPDARKVTSAERAILNRILELSFPGSETIAEQLRDFLVVPIDENGTLDFLIKDGPEARVHNSVPVEAEAEDLDGTTIHLELHVIDGITRGLHVYKEDSSRVIRMPEPSEFRIFSPPKLQEQRIAIHAHSVGSTMHRHPIAGGLMCKACWIQNRGSGLRFVGIFRRCNSHDWNLPRVG